MAWQHARYMKSGIAVHDPAEANPRGTNMSHLKRIISSTKTLHGAFQGNTFLTANSTACLFINAVGFALILIWVISAASIAFAGEVTTSTNGATRPLAPVLSTKVIVQGSDKKNLAESFVFEVPKAGKAILRMVNGAKQGAALSERVHGVELTLNGEVVVNPKSFNDETDVLEIKISVCKCTNRLVIKLLAQPDQRVAIRIDAPADKITVAPVLNAIVLGGEPLLARATVTGLGLPVLDAQVQFEVRGLGPIIRGNATTGDGGIASAHLNEFRKGLGELRATSGAKLFGVVSFIVIEKQVLSVRQHPESVKLEAGSGQAFALAIDLQEIRGVQDILTLKHVVRANGGDHSVGVLVRTDFPSTGQVVATPKTISVSPTITAVTPGRYTVTTIAAVTDKANGKPRESFRTELDVEVTKSGTPTPLRLGRPLISPSGIAPSTEDITVAIGTSIVGITKPPPVLFLDRVTRSGDFVLQEIELHDDGKEPDAKAGDGFYSGRLKLDRKEERELYFRLRTDYFGKTVTSEIATFPITRLPLGSRPSTSALVDALNGHYKLFANEVIVSTLPGVSP